MPAKQIALFTNSYPAAGAEESPFILPELQMLLEAGHSVTLIPVRRIKRVDPGLPPEVLIEHGLSDMYRAWRLPASVLRMLASGHFWREAAVALRYGKLSHLRHFLKESIRMQSVLRIAPKLLDFDVLYTYWFKGETAGVSVLKRDGQLALTRAHGYDLYEYTTYNAGYIPYRKLTLSRLDRIVLLSRSAATYLEQHYPQAGAKIFLSPLGVSDEAGAKLPPPEDEVVLLSCSYPTPNKRLPLIAQVAAQLASLMQGSKVRWVHFGCHRGQAGLDACVFPPNLSIEFQGVVTNSALRRWYTRHPVSFFINMSQSEGQPVSIMEAMAFGVPVIATAVGGVPEMLAGGEGVLLEEHSAMAALAAQSMVALLNDPARYAQMREQALRTQQARFNTRRNHKMLATEIGNSFQS